MRRFNVAMFFHDVQRIAYPLDRLLDCIRPLVALEGSVNPADFVYDGDLCAFFLAFLSNTLANAIRPAGNDRDFILEHVYIPPFWWPAFIRYRRL